MNYFWKKVMSGLIRTRRLAAKRKMRNKSEGARYSHSEFCGLVNRKICRLYENPLPIAHWALYSVFVLWH